MPYKPGSRERLYGWKSAPRDVPRFDQRTTERWKGYETERWKRESRAFKQSNPLCAECKRQGKIRGAEVTDHIIPALICPDPWNRNNWQPLCKRCNAAKGSKDRQLIERYKSENGKLKN